MHEVGPESGKSLYVSEYCKEQRSYREAKLKSGDYRDGLAPGPPPLADQTYDTIRQGNRDILMSG